jgi:DNA-directed RNA polymerase specialized sigma24 family protein
MTEDKRHEELMELLRALLKIQALSAVNDLPSKKAKILFLSEAGLSGKEIALIVGTTDGAVRQTVYEAKKKAKGEVKNGE